MSGSRSGRFRWTGPGRPFERIRRGDGSGPGPPIGRGPSRPGAFFHQRQLGEPLRVAAVQMVLVDRLRRAAIPQLRRPVGGQHDQRNPSQRSLDDGRREVDGGRARRREQDHRAARRPGDAKGEEPGRTLVDEHPHPDSAWARSASASGVEREPGQTTASRMPARASSSTKARSGSAAGGVDERAHGSSPGRPRAAATARILILDSSHSRSGSESATMPQPA
jgi:hypothetical protein